MSFGRHKPIPKKTKLSVAYIVKRLRERIDIEVNALAAEDQSAQQYVTEAELHRPGLALAGFVKLFTYQRLSYWQYGNALSQKFASRAAA